MNTYVKLPSRGSIAGYSDGMMQSSLHQALCDQSSARVWFGCRRPLGFLCTGRPCSSAGARARNAAEVHLKLNRAEAGFSLC